MHDFLYLLVDRRVLTLNIVSSRQSFIVLLFLFTKSFSSLRYFTLHLSCVINFRQSYLPILFLLIKPLFLSLITSHPSYLSSFHFHWSFLSPFFLLANPFLRFFPGSPILSSAAIASQLSFLSRLFLLTNPFYISLPSHQSFLSIYSICFHQCSCISNSSYLSIFGCRM